MARQEAEWVEDDDGMPMFLLVSISRNLKSDVTRDSTRDWPYIAATLLRRQNLGEDLKLSAKLFYVVCQHPQVDMKMQEVKASLEAQRHGIGFMKFLVDWFALCISKLCLLDQINYCIQ